jgi:hypothetical protein
MPSVQVGVVTFSETVSTIPLCFAHSRSASPYADPFAFALPPAPGEAVAATVKVSGLDWCTPDVDAQPATITAIRAIFFNLHSDDSERSVAIASVR